MYPGRAALAAVRGERATTSLNDAIADAVDELWRGGAGGDILVFLPGEREIREAADHLRKHLAHHAAARATPRCCRCSRACRRPSRTASSRPHGGRRIVLATNVAETSLTVPGIRYVIDAGTARVKRYSFRNKVEQLLVEPISQAAANQRAGRCGRVADGICIRLYDEEDFAERPRFTDPEILRSSLAGVILRMKSLHLGDVEDFPFLEPPPRARDRRRLPAARRARRGRRRQRADADRPRAGAAAARPARRPHDPGGARARARWTRCWSSPRRCRCRTCATGRWSAQQRPTSARASSTTRESEFSGYLKLWHWIEAGARATAATATATRRASTATSSPVASRSSCCARTSSTSRRVREWRDIHCAAAHRGRRARAGG